MNTAEWVLLVLGATVLILGVVRAIYVAGYRAGQELDPEDYETDGLTERFDDDEGRAA